MRWNQWVGEDTWHIVKRHSSHQHKKKEAGVGMCIGVFANKFRIYPCHCLPPLGAIFPRRSNRTSITDVAADNENLGISLEHDIG